MPVDLTAGSKSPWRPFSSLKRYQCCALSTKVEAQHTRSASNPGNVSRREMTAEILFASVLLSSGPSYAAEQGIQSSDYTVAARSSAEYREKIRWGISL